MKEFEAKVRLNEENGGKTGELDIMLKPPFDNGYFKGVTYGITFKDPVFEAGKSEWIPCSERLPEENICDDGYVEPSDYVLVFGDHGNYGVSRYWGNRRTKKENPCSFPDWMDLNWNVQKPIAWMPLPEPYKQEDEHGS